MANKHTLQELQQWQSLPLSVKVAMTKDRVRNWVHEYGEDGVYVSFSGGKDSTVLLHIVREAMGYKNIPAVFVDTGLEYPEIREFVKTFDNVEWLRPKMNFRQVIEKYGYPFISKEVSESVQGARKYLTSILEEMNAPTDRQTDSTRISISTIECADKASMQSPTRGGQDNKYRKLRGIGEYSKRENGKPQGRKQSAISEPIRMENEKSNSTDKGEYP